MEHNNRERNLKVIMGIFISVFLIAMVVVFFLLKKDKQAAEEPWPWEQTEESADTFSANFETAGNEQQAEERQQSEEEQQAEEERRKAQEEQQAEEEQQKAEEERQNAEADAMFMEMYSGDYEKECAVGDGTIRYRMVIRDAAAGSRAYSLLKSTDGGDTWGMASGMPFGNHMGMGIDFTFLDENFGFASLAHNGGDEAELYVTEDGGLTYELCSFEEYNVPFSDGTSYHPYDYPEMPYEKDGVLYVFCGQGQDGDYNGGDKMLYTSVDGGHTFTLAESADEQ